MTNACATMLNDGFIFECNGHSGYSKKGTDIVCAGISALCIALEKRLFDMERENMLSVEFEHCTDGEMYIEIRFADNPICVARVTEALQTVMSGLESIAELYPENLTVNTV